MVGVRQKAPGLLANQRGGRGRGMVVAVPEQRAVPRMPPAPSGLKWGRRTRALWRGFWRSPVSAAVDQNADGERLYRWMEAVEERERLLAEVREHGYAPARKVVSDQETDEGRVIVLVEGPHPHLVYIKHLDKEIARLSEHFGMTPLSRFRLQITYSDAGVAADKLAKIQRRQEREPAAGAAEVVDLDAM